MTSKDVQFWVGYSRDTRVSSYKYLVASETAQLVDALVAQKIVTRLESESLLWDSVVATGEFCMDEVVRSKTLDFGADKVYGIPVQLTLGKICNACMVVDGKDLIINLGLPSTSGIAKPVAARGGSGAGEAESRLPVVATWKYSKDKAASAFSLSTSKEGLDVPMGWGMAVSAYLPPGRVRTEVELARSEAAAGSEQYLAFAQEMRFFEGLPLCRSLSRVEESVIQDSWGTNLPKWWPNDACENARPESLPFPLLLGKSCKVDYVRVGSVGAHQFVTAVGELKNSDLAPLDGAPQAVIAAMSAAAHMRAHGLSPHDCVVPFFMSNGQLEQHGAVFLLEPCMPSAVMTSPVLDVSDPDGRRRVSAARWACRRMAERTHALLQAHFSGPAAAAPAARLEPAAGVDAVAALDTSKYLFKRPLDLVGPTRSHAVLHQLSVYERLLSSDAARFIVPPAAALMQMLVGDEDECKWRWAAKQAIAFPRLEGFTTGVPKIGQPHRHAVLAGLKAALQALHGAGVIHMDLYPGNIMWRPTHLLAERGAAAGGAGSAAVGGAGSRPAEVEGTCSDALPVEVRLVDLDAALYIDQRVPAHARSIVERNGHTHTYHPCFFADFEGRPRLQKAVVDFDWWHYALLAWPDAVSEAACPFVDVCCAESKIADAATAKILAWRRDKLAVVAVLETVEHLVAEERGKLRAGPGGSALQGLVERFSLLSM